MTHDGDEIDRFGRAPVGAHLQPAQRQEVVDEPAHALGLLQHDAQEPLGRRRVRARRTHQRFDEARERGERRAQLVAGVGDEIGPHARQRELLGDVVERDEKEGGRIGQPHRADGDRIDPLGIAALAVGDGRALPLRGAPERLHELRRAEREGQGIAGPRGGKFAPRQAVGEAQGSARIEHEDRARRRFRDRLHGRIRPDGPSVPPAGGRAPRDGRAARHEGRHEHDRPEGREPVGDGHRPQGAGEREGESGGGERNAGRMEARPRPFRPPATRRLLSIGHGTIRSFRAAAARC
jgi:hypothetical protein